MVSCKEKVRYVIQEKDRIISFGDKGTVLVTDKCVVIMTDSASFNNQSGVIHHSLATRVYILPVVPVTNNISTTLLSPSGDTVRVLSKEKIEELQRRFKEEKSRFEKRKNKK